MSHYIEADYMVVNDDFEVALNQLMAIVSAQHCRLPVPARKNYWRIYCRNPALGKSAAQQHFVAQYLTDYYPGGLKMARITVEDCLDHVDNVLNSHGWLQARRQIATEGRPPLVAEENDKPTVIALREIEEGLVTKDILNETRQDYEIVDGEEEMVKLKLLSRWRRRSCCRAPLKLKLKKLPSNHKSRLPKAHDTQGESLALRLLLDKLFYLDAKEVSRVERAQFAEKCHEGQMRQSGDAYISHPLAVAHILADMHMDHESLMAAMLHDVIEDTGVTKGQISRRFGRPVADLVDGVSKLTEIEFESKAHQQAESFQKMTLAMSRDKRCRSSPTGCTICAPSAYSLRPNVGESPGKPWISTLLSPSAWVSMISAWNLKTSALPPCTRCVTGACARR